MPSVQRCGTRGFRPPEVLLRTLKQGKAIDIWAVGVIMLSVMTRRYPFFHSIDDMTAIAEIACLFGKKLFCKLTNQVFNRKVKIGFKIDRDENESFKEYIKRIRRVVEIDIVVWSSAAYDLLEKMLDLDPKKRINAFEALEHEFLKF